MTYRKWIEGCGPQSDSFLAERIQEELNELSIALDDWFTFSLPGDDEDYQASILDEMMDVIFTIKVLCVVKGWNYHAAEQHKIENNLSKLTNGKIKKRSDGKILKPDGYTPTDMRSYL